MKLLKHDYVSRPAYVEKIRPFIGKNLIKVIVGQRRVGKSYLLFELMEVIRKGDKKANIIYINKEDHHFDVINNHKNLIDHVEKAVRKGAFNYLFIDEIQDIADFEKALRHFALYKNLDIYCTGSNADLLSGELATYLSGRCIEFKVYSLSYPEFLTFHQLVPGEDSLNKYMLWGGMPFLRNLQKTNEIITEYLENVFTTIIYKDIIARHQVRNTNFLENLVRFLAFNAGSIISAKKISDYLKSQRIKMSPQIVLNYLDHLRQAYLIFHVRRADLSGKKIFEINEKYYFEDWGIMNSIRGFSNFDAGKVIENIIYMHLLMQGYSVCVGKIGDKEIDFVCEKSGEKVYIQAAFLIPDEKVKKREFGNLASIPDQYPKMVVSLDPHAPKNVEGIRHLHLIDFLRS